jgi:hypothetical protein
VGIRQQIVTMGSRTEEKIKTTFIDLLLISLRGISGFFLGLTIALIGQELVQFGSFSLVFLTIVVMGIFLRISTGWLFTKILVFDLICILVIQLFKMYILIAP